MGVTERKAREKKALKKKIIKAATKLFLQHGYEGTSIRMIAKEIEYSPATLYLYFKDKNALFELILEEAYTQFRVYLYAANIIADPLSRLQEISKRYIQFAADQSVYYDLIFIHAADIGEQGLQKDYAQQTHQIFIDLIRECKKNSYFLSKDPVSLSLLIWSFVHGVVSLKLKNRLDNFDKETLTVLIEKSVNEFFSQLRNN